MFQDKSNIKFINYFHWIINIFERLTFTQFFVAPKSNTLYKVSDITGESFQKSGGESSIHLSIMNHSSHNKRIQSLFKLIEWLLFIFLCALSIHFVKDGLVQYQSKESNLAQSLNQSPSYQQSQFVWMTIMYTNTTWT